MAGPVLYKRVITDDLYSVIDDGDSSPDQLSTPSPAHPEIRSKAQLLRLIQYLALEYPAFNLDLTYTQILSGNEAPRTAPALVGREGKACSIGFKKAWHSLVPMSRRPVYAASQWPYRPYSTHRLLYALDKLRQLNEDGAYPIRLQALSTCAYLGSVLNFWTNAPVARDTVDTIRALFKTALLEPSLAGYACFRSSRGFFALAPDTPARSSITTINSDVAVTMYMLEWMTPPAIDIRRSTTFVHERPYTPCRGCHHGGIPTARIYSFDRRKYGEAVIDNSPSDVYTKVIAQAAEMYVEQLMSETAAMELERGAQGDLSVERNNIEHGPTTEFKAPLRFFGSKVRSHLHSDANGDEICEVEDRKVVRLVENRVKDRVAGLREACKFEMGILADAPACPACEP